MSIYIGERFRIDADDLNYTLYEQAISTRGKMAGSMTWQRLGYYPSVAMALEKILKTLTAREVAALDMSLPEYLNALVRIWENLKAWSVRRTKEIEKI